MKIAISFTIFLFLLSCQTTTQKKEICYDDILYFIDRITHRYDLIVYSIDELNSCFIKKNPNIRIHSTVYLDGYKKSEQGILMESISYINKNSLITKREAKMWWRLKSSSSDSIWNSKLKWEYVYNNNDKLIKEIRFSENVDTSAVIGSNYSIQNESALFKEKIIWKAYLMDEIIRDSLNRIQSKIKYFVNDTLKEAYGSNFNYSDNIETEEYFNEPLSGSGKIIKVLDEEGNIIKVSSYKLKSDKWLLVGQTEIFFDKFNRRKIEIYTGWSWWDQKVEDKLVKTYSYNENEKLTTITTISEHYYNSENIETVKDTLIQKFEYDSNGYISKLEYGDIFLFTYDKNGFIEKFIWQGERNDGESKDFLKVTQTYSVQ